MSSADKPRATVYTERNEGIQIGEHHEEVETKNVSYPTYLAGEHHENVQIKHEHHYHSDAEPVVGAYFRGLGVDPEDSRTKALASAGDNPIKSCWDRILTRPEFEEWRKKQDTCVLWVVGGPGKGKTILSLGLVDELGHATHPDGGKAFVGYFFCRDMDSTTNTATSILKGLIYGLGQEDRDLMRFLSDKFKSPEDIKGVGIATFWGILVKMITALTTPRDVYLVVDALDECRDEGEIRAFLDLVRKASFRRSVKWVFTSRQSPQHRRSLGSGAGIYTIDLDTSKEVEQSVDEYLDLVVGANQQFSGPQKQQILDLLRSDAEKTFLYVSLVLEDLRMASDMDVSKWICDLKNNVHGESVYRRYRLMLQRVIEKDEQSGTTTLQDLLKAVLMATKTLSLPELAIAAGLPFEYYDPKSKSDGHRRTTELVQQCGHILRVAEGKVYLVHKSAKDYLTMGDGSDDGTFISSSFSSTEHALIAERSLQALDSELLPKPDLSNLDSLKVCVPSQESLQWLRSLLYVYSHWSHHVAQAQGAFTSWSLVERFLETGFLAWVEVMGHLDQIQRCIDMVQELQSAIDGETKAANTSPGNKALLDDAFQFLVRYRQMIQVHPRQVYLLAKYFTPKTSLMRKNYEHIPCCLRICNNPSSDWDPCQYTLDVSGHQWGDKDRRKVTFPRYERSGFNLKKGYFSFKSRDFQLSFSPDGKTVSAGSSTLGRNVLRWNVVDGSFAGSFDAAEDGIGQSNDGGFIASWTEKGVRVRDSRSGHLRCRLDHSPVNCRFTMARFSPDGSAIAVAFEETALFRQKRYHLKVWDAVDGSFLQEIYDTAEDRVRDVRFVRDGHLVAVLLDNALFLHDTRNRGVREMRLCDMSKPHAASLSDDGTILAIVTQSSIAFHNVDPFTKLARWTVPQNEPGLDTYFRQEQEWTRPKPNLGIEIAISGDGATAALAFRDTIAFFRLGVHPLSPTRHSTNKYLSSIEDEEFFQSKLPIVDALKFSPCGAYLACARNDDVISIWDVRASCRELPSRTAPAKGLRHLKRHGRPGYEWASVPVYSPDGSVCGTQSADRVDLWDVATASVKLRVQGTSCLGFEDLNCRNPSCIGWAFSPDSRFALTVIKRRMYRVDLRDWTHVKETLPGRVTTLAFNSSGTLFALATYNDPPQVLLFEAASGRCLLKYKTRCISIHAMTFSSSGTLIAGGPTYTNHMYYIWDKLDYESLNSFAPSRCVEMSAAIEMRQAIEMQQGGYGRHGPGVLRIMRIASSPDNSMAVSIFCNFMEGAIGVIFAAYAETISLADSRMVSSIVVVADDSDTNCTNYVEISVRGRNDYNSRTTELVHCPGVGLAIDRPLISTRFGRGTQGMTACGIEITPPAVRNRNTCNDIAISYDGGFSWVTWKGQRILCFPHHINWARRDVWDQYLMIAHEPDSVSFVSSFS